MAFASMAGFECETADEVAVQKGTASISTTGPMQNPHENSALRIGDASTIVEVIQGHGAITTNSSHYITMGMYLRFDDATPATTMTFFGINNYGSGIGGRSHMKLELNTSGQLQMVSNGGTTTAMGDSLASNTWYLVEIELNINSTGYCKLYVDEVNVANDSSGDFYATGSTSEARWKGSGIGASSRSYDIGSFYILEDASSQPARIGNYSVLLYNFDDSTATPNITGDDLDNSTDWQDSSQIPGSDASYSEYTSTHSGIVETSFSGGNRIAGPKGDKRRNGDHRCATWTYRAKEGAGFGFGSTFKFKYGAGDGSDGTTSTGNQSVTTAAQYRIIDEGSIMPGAEEYFQYGFEHVSGKPIRLLDCWCHLLTAANDEKHIGRGVNKWSSNGTGQ